MSRFLVHSAVRRGSRSALMCLLLASGASPVTRGDDRVTVLPEGKSKPIVVVGDVQSFDARMITIRVKSGIPIQTFPTESVLDVETRQVPGFTRGIDAFESGDIARAEAEFLQAVSLEKRLWVREEIYGWLVRCARRRGDRTAAGEYFNQILSIEAETRQWGLVPLVWAAETINAALQDSAAKWLTSLDEGTRLMGASALLLDSRRSEAAQREMDKLARSPDQIVNSLARAQLWRIRLVDAELTRNELESWRAQIERMPAELRAGPMYLAGRAAALQNDTQQAATDWLWLPLVYTQDEPLAGRACLDAADALARLGRHDEALTLYEEVVDRFGFTPSAQEARQRVSELSGDPSDRRDPDGSG
ncbi:MAG: hypothetical protein DWQ34_26235 [Planctomycetota bacterium]|nr:MAG: hypothetical protein DWQ34_26235 [Planctomycetota bacterium]REK20480.1 MAG: hypothetical protein DWQ41_25070 [Planctomycetota bacterium]REK33857.1 MAG: hypothetical protein DWQ45_14850 [Planctomycetota bacterium]